MHFQYWLWKHCNRMLMSGICSEILVLMEKKGPCDERVCTRASIQQSILPMAPTCGAQLLKIGLDACVSLC